MDPNQMEQVFVNLLVNAMNAMPEGGDLEISTAIVEDDRQTDFQSKAIIVIKDNGIGISLEHIQSIFDPFFTTKEDGTGLGLPISLGIVENHGGVLRIESVEGSGTIATIELTLSNLIIQKGGVS